MPDQTADDLARILSLSSSRAGDDRRPATVPTATDELARILSLSSSAAAGSVRRAVPGPVYVDSTQADRHSLLLPSPAREVSPVDRQSAHRFSATPGLGRELSPSLTGFLFYDVEEPSSPACERLSFSCSTDKSSLSFELYILSMSQRAVARPRFGSKTGSDTDESSMQNWNGSENGGSYGHHLLDSAAWSDVHGPESYGNLRSNPYGPVIKDELGPAE